MKSVIEVSSGRLKREIDKVSSKEEQAQIQFGSKVGKRHMDRSQSWGYFCIKVKSVAQ